MAEALAALGVAANVMAVISFCHETVDLAAKIHKTGSVNPDLAQNAKRIETLYKQLDLSMHNTAQSGSSGSPAQQELSAIAKDCSSASKELVKELESITKSKSGTIIKVAKTFWKKSKLEKLENTMQQRQRVLDSRLLVELL